MRRPASPVLYITKPSYALFTFSLLYLATSFPNSSPCSPSIASHRAIYARGTLPRAQSPIAFFYALTRLLRCEFFCLPNFARSLSPPLPNAEDVGATTLACFAGSVPLVPSCVFQAWNMIGWYSCRRRRSIGKCRCRL